MLTFDKMKTKGSMLGAALILILACISLIYHIRTPGPSEIAIYRIMQQLSPGMTVEGVSAIVDRNLIPAVRTHRTKTRITVSTPVFLWDAIHLRIDFVEGKLAAARIRNADADAPITRAPPDIARNDMSSNKILQRTPRGRAVAEN